VVLVRRGELTRWRGGQPEGRAGTEPIEAREPLFLFSYDSTWLRIAEKSLVQKGKGRPTSVLLRSVFEDTEPSELIGQRFAQAAGVLGKLHPVELSVRVAVLHAEPAGLYSRNPALGIDAHPAFPESEIAGRLAGMLTLAFPEVRWVFASSPDMSDADGGALSKPDGVPLFDPLGRRALVRKDIKTDLGTAKDADYLCVRERSAAAIDEELAYSFLTGYLAYRLTYNTHMVCTEAEMKRVFGFRDARGQKIDVICRPAPHVKLTFEDLFLGFPDHTDHSRTKDGKVECLHFSNLENRDWYFPGLREVTRRVFVTAGHGHYDARDANGAYLRKRKLESEVLSRTVCKPVAGVYSVLKRARLLSDYMKLRRDEWKTAKAHKVEGGQTGHSASGRLLLIADSLIGRAEKLFDEARSVPDCIYAATLALEAQELLGYRTPTTSLEAITLRHKLEVKAECMFQGMEYNIAVKDRFWEIHGEVDAVSRWFNPATRERSALNAEMSIVTEVMRIFHEFGQYDEEQECMKHFRKLNRQAYFAQHPWLSVFRPFRWYVETIVGSFWLFVIALLAWPLLFGVLGYVVKAGFGPQVSNVAGYTVSAFYTFFCLQPPSATVGIPAHVLTMLTVIAGFAHLGIFISHLYSLVARK
jgi:hypothetical protein